MSHFDFEGRNQKVCLGVRGDGMSLQQSSEGADVDDAWKYTLDPHFVILLVFGNQSFSRNMVDNPIYFCPLPRIMFNLFIDFSRTLLIY